MLYLLLIFLQHICQSQVITFWVTHEEKNFLGHLFLG